MSKIHTLKREQLIKRPIEEIWEFFSSPENLNELTPNDMKFYITSFDAGEKIYPGKIIIYKVSPFAGIKFNWTSEISHVVEGKLFVDEQRIGPYKFWHHKHIFEPADNGILMIDIVHYVLPYGFIGEIFHGIIKKKLDWIFKYRYRKVEEIFKR